ncbi:MAG: HDOD domain-containing protein [Aureliella sp.]
MPTKTRILFVDDEPHILSGLERMLFDCEDEWEMEFVTSGRAALVEFTRNPFDVLVTDMRMPEMDGAELLLAVQKQWPASVRIILSGQAEQEAILRAVGPSHQFLAKPCEFEKLRKTISRACQLHTRLAIPELKTLVAGQSSLPCMPRIYQLLIHELQAPQPSPARAAELIGQDVGMSCKLLQIVNSALHGRPVKLNSTLDVVKAIGIDRLRPLVLTSGIFAAFPETPFSEEHNERFIQHSSSVSRLAQLIVEREMPGDTAAAGVALLGGLIHDVGMLALAQCKGLTYQQIVTDAHLAESSTCMLERRYLGCDHAQIGAYLLALWGVPDDIVETVAFHHAPSLSRDQGFTPTTAVHVANALDHAQRYGVPEQLDMPYLERIGVDGRKLSKWREMMSATDRAWFYPAIVDGARDLAGLTGSSSAACIASCGGASGLPTSFSSSSSLEA